MDYKIDELETIYAKKAKNDARLRRERKRMWETNIEDVDFQIAPDMAKIRNYGFTCISSLVGGFLLPLPGEAEEIIGFFKYGKPIRFVEIKSVLVILGVLLVFVYTIQVVETCLRSRPRIRGSVMYYKGLQYHFSEITKVTESRFHTIRVYVKGRKKSLFSSGDVLLLKGSESFLIWAEKCNIPVKRPKRIRHSREKVLSPRQKAKREAFDRAGQKGIYIALMTMAVFSVLCFFGAFAVAVYVFWLEVFGG